MESYGSSYGQEALRKLWQGRAALASLARAQQLVDGAFPGTIHVEARHEHVGKLPLDFFNKHQFHNVTVDEW
jgi:hypothetical protein